MAMGKDISFSFHPKLKSKNNFVEAFLFGIVYGLAALGCLFPLFLSVAFFAFNAPTFLIGGIYLLVYMVGMSMFMLAFYIVTTFAKQWLQRSLSKILPYVMRVSGGLVAIAGVYMIWYNWALL